ncbi:MAG: LolA family protein [Candidatus Aminicenantales bacterium]
MKKNLTLTLAGLFLFLISSLVSPSQTTKDVLDRMIEAQGGRKVLETIKDTTMSGTIEIIQVGVNGSATLYMKEPNKMRLDIEFMGMVISHGYDGEVAWMVNPQTGQAEQLPENFSREIKRQALGNDALLHPEKYGITYEFKGTEKIEAKDYLVLEQTMSDGHKITHYLDPATYLIYKSKGMALNQAGMEVMGETVFSDYRKVNGAVVAHALTTSQDGQEYMRMTMTKVAFNSNLEDSLFTMPK